MTADSKLQITALLLAYSYSYLAYLYTLKHVIEEFQCYCMNVLFKILRKILKSLHSVYFKPLVKTYFEVLLSFSSMETE